MYGILYPVVYFLVVPGTVHTHIYSSPTTCYTFILFDPGFVRMCANENPLLRFL
jgi:hypothetical protein